MLVLSRQKDESIMIGDDVEITIVDVRGDKVRLAAYNYNDVTLRVAARRDRRPERTLCPCHLWGGDRSDQRFRKHDHGE